MSSAPCRSESERGQSIVLIALMMAGLVAFVGLALDGGQIFEMRRQMQNAADAAALAGARELAFDGTHGKIFDKIHQYAIGGNGVGNGADSAEGIFLPSGSQVVPGLGAKPLPTDNCVEVTTNKTFSTMIISFLGFNTLSVSALARACTGPLRGTSSPLRPIVVYTQTFVPGREYRLFTSTLNAPGNFGWLDFNAGNNSTGDTVYWMYEGFSPSPSNPVATFGWQQNCPQNNPDWEAVFYIPRCLAGDTGVAVAKEVRDSGDSLKNNGKDITILIYDRANAQGASAKYHVIAFARFLITYVNLTGSPKEIRGIFMGWVLPGDICWNCKCFSPCVRGVTLTR